ncbi:Rho guanine nucleotide exchange factor scd1 [Psilocybe cubensis]|uniref:Rho guanine nucleotide exchange factor scd1 n=2 Tax=Psilocybe cubensis TaxID=181762 RepID=A0ACB8HFG8_PSICU|nr:Rho guanine nucleotide exchange factor scd1 [Psilocybe cubensis]KAH9486760.1 Rho guanine nucleotide exchange factor scd1 [Psilocybe cubensis]
MASIGRRQIDTKFLNSGILNKSASQSSSLYQKCSLLRGRLRRIRGFAELFPDVVESPSRDPVAYIWDLFSTGTPLCYIYDQLPADEGFKKINHYALSKRNYETESETNRAKKHAIALFAMELRVSNITEKISGCEMFTVTELWDRHSTDGLVKVVDTVTAIVDHLPPEVFDDDVASEDPSNAANVHDAVQQNIIREMLETERKYVQNLEVLQSFSNALSQGNIVSQDTIHLLFPNLNKLLNFQRKFLISLEFTAQLPLQVQRWGQLFLENEEEFSVYEPYCVNYKHATELMVDHERDLSSFNHILNAKSELPALLLKPIQRVCQYPLLLESLVKALPPEVYEHHYELIRASESAKRIITKINEAQRRNENQEIVKDLAARVADWKGHHIENFGELVLHESFTVTKSDVDRNYEAFLFEKILILCKEATAPVNKRKKNQAILKKSVSVATPQPQKPPLLLKGRIFIANVVSAKPTTPNRPNSYPLGVYWKGDYEVESFTMHCRREEQMKQWQTAVTRLVTEAASRRIQLVAEQKINGVMRTQIGPTPHTPTSLYSLSSDFATIGGRNRYSAYNEDEESNHYGPDSASEDGELEEYIPPSCPSSGRSTPVERRRLYKSRSLSAKFLSCKNLNGSPLVFGKITRSRSFSVPYIDTSKSTGSPRESSPPTPVSYLTLLSTSHAMDREWPPHSEDSKVNKFNPSIPMVKLKIRYYDDIFIIHLPKMVDFAGLYANLERKIRLCGPRKSTAPLRVKYRDADGDMISLTSTEDLQIALDHEQVITLFVT